MRLLLWIMDPIEKSYRADQIREQIMAGISVGSWGEYLPSERKLSTLFGTGRDQVHQAILQLRNLGVLELKGKRNLIVHEAVNDTPQPIKNVTVLTSRPLDETSSLFLFVIDQLRARLLPVGVDLKVESCKLLLQDEPKEGLRQVVETHPESVWLLQGATPGVQRWFAENELPVIVLGTAVDNIAFIDFDHTQAMLHAVSLMTTGGRTAEQLIFVRPDVSLVGIDAMENAFVQAAGEKATTRVLRYNENPDAVLRCFERLPWQHASRPQGVLFGASSDAIKFCSWLAMHTDLAVGRDVSVISIVDNPALDHTYPAIAHYSLRSHRYTSPLVRLVKRVIDRKNLKRGHQLLIVPDFVKGGSL